MNELEEFIELVLLRKKHAEKLKTAIERSLNSTFNNRNWSLADVRNAIYAALNLNDAAQSEIAEARIKKNNIELSLAYKISSKATLETAYDVVSKWAKKNGYELPETKGDSYASKER